MTTREEREAFDREVLHVVRSLTQWPSDREVARVAGGGSGLYETIHDVAAVRAAVSGDPSTARVTAALERLADTGQLTRHHVTTGDEPWRYRPAKRTRRRYRLTVIDDMLAVEAEVDEATLAARAVEWAEGRCDDTRARHGGDNPRYWPTTSNGSIGRELQAALRAGLVVVAEEGRGGLSRETTYLPASRYDAWREAMDAAQARFDRTAARKAEATAALRVWSWEHGHGELFDARDRSSYVKVPVQIVEALIAALPEGEG